jgi:tetratricopeptide (TPR) repeat protein
MIEDDWKAFEFYQQILAMVTTNLPEYDPALATVYNCIGTVYHDMEDNSKALEFYRKALTIQQVSLSSSHPDLAYTYSNIGTMYTLMGDESNALSFNQKAIAIRGKWRPEKVSDSMNESTNE